MKQVMIERLPFLKAKCRSYKPRLTRLVWRIALWMSSWRLLIEMCLTGNCKQSKNKPVIRRIGHRSMNWRSKTDFLMINWTARFSSKLLFTKNRPWMPLCKVGHRMMPSGVCHLWGTIQMIARVQVMPILRSQGALSESNAIQIFSQATRCIMLLTRLTVVMMSPDNLTLPCERRAGARLGMIVVRVTLHHVLQPPFRIVKALVRWATWIVRP